MFAFFGLRYLAMSPVGSSLRKLNTGVQLQTFPYPSLQGIKIVSVLQSLHGEIGLTISDVQKRDEETDKQTDKQTDKKKFYVFGRTSGRCNRSPIKLGTVIEDLDHVLAP